MLNKQLNQNLFSCQTKTLIEACFLSNNYLNQSLFSCQTKALIETGLTLNQTVESKLISCQTKTLIEACFPVNQFKHLNSSPWWGGSSDISVSNQIGLERTDEFKTHLNHVFLFKNDHDKTFSCNSKIVCECLYCFICVLHSISVQAPQWGALITLANISERDKNSSIKFTNRKIKSNF